MWVFYGNTHPSSIYIACSYQLPTWPNIAMFLKTCRMRRNCINLCCVWVHVNNVKKIVNWRLRTPTPGVLGLHLRHSPSPSETSRIAENVVSAEHLHMLPKGSGQWRSENPTHQMLKHKSFTFPGLLQGWQGWWTAGVYNVKIREFIWCTTGHVISKIDPRWRKALLLRPYSKTCVWLVPLSGLPFGNFYCDQKTGFICEINF